MTNAATAATSQTTAPTAMIGHGSSSQRGSGGGSRFLPGSSDIAINLTDKPCLGDSLLTAGRSVVTFAL